jgi:hypothetical protein
MNKIEEDVTSGKTPYDVYKGTPLWLQVEKAMTNLVINRDIVETTPRDYIVGYLCQAIQQGVAPTEELN